MSKLERLMNLAAALLATPRPLTAEQLRERIPGYPDDKASFRRAFERDKASLREMGLPVDPEPVPGTDPPVEGYRIRPDAAFLRDPGLEPDELAALHLAASVVRLEGVEEREALYKLGGVTGPPPSSTDGGADPSVAPLPFDANVVALFAAVTGRQAAAFRYNDVDREVHPYRLDFQRGHWYLTAFDRVRDEERAFRIDRIDGEVTLVGHPGAFSRPEEAVPGLQLEPWQLGEEQPLVARVLVDADQAPAAVQQLGDDAVEEQRPDGSVIVALEVTNRAGFRSFALGFLEHAEVLEPPELRAEVVAWLTDLAEGSVR